MQSFLVPSLIKTSWALLCVALVSSTSMARNSTLESSPALAPATTSTPRPLAPLSDHGSGVSNRHPNASPPTYSTLAALHEAWDRASQPQRELFVKRVFSMQISAPSSQPKGLFNEKKPSAQEPISDADAELMARDWANLRPRLMRLQDRLNELSQAMEECLR